MGQVLQRAQVRELNLPNRPVGQALSLLAALVPHTKDVAVEWVKGVPQAQLPDKLFYATGQLLVPNNLDANCAKYVVLVPCHCLCLLGFTVNAPPSKASSTILQSGELPPVDDPHRPLPLQPSTAL
mgnify:CR=1 FL=1